MKSYVAIQKKLLILIYTLWKNNEAFDKNKVPKQTTRDKEPMSPSQLSFEEAGQDGEKNSHDKNRDYTRWTTVDKSPLAPSQLLQN